MTDTPRRLECPSWFDDERRQVWDDTVRRLTDAGGLFRADPKVLETYVAAYVAHAHASRLVADGGVLLNRTYGPPVENPALQVQRRTAADLAKASKILGLHRTPMLDTLAESPMRGDGSKWCPEHQRRECKYPCKDGSPCHGYSLIPGTGACRMHVGMKIEAARAKGQANLARLYSTPVDIDPGGALLDEVQWAAGHVRELRAQVSELAEQPGPDGEPGSGLWWGVAEELRRDGEVVEQKLKAGPHAKLAEYGRERDRLVKVAAAAHAAGAHEAAVNVAAALGAGMHAFLDRIFHGLELLDWQWERVGTVVPQVIAEYDPESTATGTDLQGQVE